MAVNKSMLILRGALLLSLFGAGASQLTGCAQDVGTVDRTRPDKVKKSIFEGDDEWYFRQTVIDTPTQGAIAVGSVGTESMLKRIRWTITEDTLFAYSTTEPAIGTEKGLQDAKDRRLGIVAAYPIVKHFDIQRGYSSSTGQLSNTIEENTSDRLWYQRDYMRVDWTGNRIDGLGMFGADTGRYSLISRTVPESDSPKDYNRTRITDDSIDVVSEYYFEPNYWMCGQNFGYESQWQCEAGPMKVRTSFIKVPKKKTFEPVEYFDFTAIKDDDGKPLYTVPFGGAGEELECTPELKQLLNTYFDYSRPDLCLKTAKFDLFKRFGFFETKRAVYSKRRGTGYIAKKKFYANHWNIWQTAYDEDGNLLKYEDRKPKQIVYYLNVGFPEDKPYREGVELLEQGWNDVFTKTVALTHNFTQLTGQSVYSWMMNLLAEANKADQTGSDVPTSDDIKKRLTYPSELAAQGLDYLKGIDAENPSPMAGGWIAFCSSHNVLGASCASMTGGELKEAIDTHADSFAQTTQTFNLLDDPFFAAVFELVRDYTTASASGFKPTDKALLSYFKDVKASIADKSLRSSLNEPKFDDAKGTKLLKFIADNNGGDDHMFRIKENSCSPVKLEEWQKKYGTVNDDVKNLFDKQGSDVKASLRKLPLENLMQFCAQLEYYTRDEQDKAARFDWQRTGDLRYSFVNWVDREAGWLGYGPSAADPETGQIISATANFAGRSIERAATAMADNQLYFDGRISEDDMKTGGYIKYDLENNVVEEGDVILKKRDTSLGQQLPLSSAAETLRRTDDSLRSFARLSNGPRGWNLTDAGREESRKLLMEKGGYEGVEAEVAQKIIAAEKVRDKKLRKINVLMNQPESLSALLANPDYANLVDSIARSRFGDGPFTEDQRMSVLNQINTPMLFERENEARRRFLGLKNMYPMEALDNAVEATITLRAWSDYFKDKSREEIETYFKRGMLYGVQLHELGHTFGLRHNFSGSMDAFNYNPGYWDVVAKSYEKGEQEVPWYLSEEDFESQTGRKLPGSVKFFNQAEFRGTASIMDYTPDLSLDFTGLGKYDDAAIQFVYGRQIEIFDDSVNFTPDDAFDLDIGYNYKDIPAVFTGEPAGKNRDDLVKSGDFKEKAKLYPAAIKRMLSARRWVSVDDVLKMKRDAIKKRTDAISSTLKSTLSLPSKSRIQRVQLQSEKVRGVSPVPYKFCSDEYSNNIGCEVWDWGASQEEVAKYRIGSFETFKNRDRYARGIYSPRNRVAIYYLSRLARTLSQLQNVFYNYSWYVSSRYSFYKDYREDLQRTTALGLNFFAQLISQPSVGAYCLRTTPGSSPIWDNRGKSVEKCPNDYKVISSLDGVIDGYWGSSTYLRYYMRVPYVFEKNQAMQALFAVSGTYSDALYTDVDQRHQDTSYWGYFRKQLYDYLEGAILSEPEQFAGAMTDDGKYIPPSIVSFGYLKALNENRTPSAEELDPLRNYARVSTNLPFNTIYTGILYGLIFANTQSDTEEDLFQYMKICVNEGECSQEYLEVDESYNAPGVVKGRKLADYNLDLTPFSENPTLKKVTGEPTTTYFAQKGGYEVHTFYAPDSAVILRAPVRKGQRSIAVKLIDNLNFIVYGAKEPVLEDVLTLDLASKRIGGYYLIAKDIFETVKAQPPGSPNYARAEELYRIVQGNYSYYRSIVDIIRDIMKRSQGLY